MNIRFSQWAISLLVVAATVLTAGRSLAIHYDLGPSEDEWGLKYDVELQPAAGGKVNVRFTLADAGRLRPIYSVTVIAFSKTADAQGGRVSELKAPIELSPLKDGRYAGEAEIGKEFLDRAQIRILTLTFDGKRQTKGARYFDIPIQKFVNRTPTATAPKTPPTVATPPTPTLRK